MVIRILLFAVATTCVSQQLPSRPTFNQFPPTKVFRGTPAPPKLATKEQRTFRTMIRTGGDSRATFAGHYTIPEWGCGTDCSQFAILEAETGMVYGPFAVAGLPGTWLDKHAGQIFDHVEFKTDSRLLKVNGCPNELNCGFYDYEMVDGIGLKLLHKELLPSEYQPRPQ